LTDAEDELGRMPERTCLACRSHIERDDGIRFLRDADGVPTIDWKGRGGGRGAWICWKAACLRAASQPGRLERAWKAELRRPTKTWPQDEIGEMVLRRQREFLGLGARVGQLRSGGNVVDRAITSGWAVGVALATDAGATVASDLERRAHGLSLPCYRLLLDAEAAGQALGKDGARSVFAIGPGPLGASLLTWLRRGREGL
jgi:predicted RNA-binding protein YlxR (DUF448 family)